MGKGGDAVRLASVLRSLLVGVAAAYACVLAFVFASRWAWPFDLEWMEGGMLTHAVRLRLGQPIYVAPSADFIPFFYTPLYSMTVAAIATLGAPLGFALGRAVSIAATFATMAILYATAAREAGRTWGVFAACLYAAFFRFCGAFYDVVRPDAMAMALALAGAAVAYRAATSRAAALAGLLLVGAFFTKQTTAVFVPAIALALLARDRRLAAAFAATAGGVGALSVWAATRATSGWFWFYIFEGHQGHRFLWDNFRLEYWRDVLFLAPSLLLFPVVALAERRRGSWFAGALAIFLVAAFAQRAATLNYPPHMYYRELWYETPRALVLVPPLLMAALLAAAVWERRRAAAVPAAPGLPAFWLWMAAAGAFASALNHSTQWAYANCFMPVTVFGSLAVALTLADHVEGARTPAILASGAMLVQLVALAYDPRAQVPTRDDSRALADFTRRVRAVRGPVFIPSHPFAAYQASGRVHLHQMGIGDVAFHGGVRDLAHRLARGEWPTAIVDDGTHVPDLDQSMYVSDRFEYARDELFSKTGFRVRPLTLWRLQDRIEREVAQGITGSFEAGRLAGWTSIGGAFGDRAATRRELGDLKGIEGDRAASSRGSAGGGALVSAPFVLDAPRVTFLVAGSRGAYVRAMQDDVEIARVQPVAAGAMAPRSLELAAWVGRRVHLEVIDEERISAAGEEHEGIVVDDFRTSW
jgi:hypothetical protein